MGEPSASKDKTDPSTESRLRQCFAVANEQEWLASSNPDAMERLLTIWLTGGMPRAMLYLTEGTALDRRFRLYACACVRRVWHFLDDERLRRAVEVAEAFADGLAQHEEMRKAEAAAEAYALRIGNERRGGVRSAAHSAHQAAYAGDVDLPSGFVKFVAHGSTAAASTAALAEAGAAKTASEDQGEIEACAQAKAAESAADAAHAVVLRDIIGNPFRPPPTMDARFRTGRVLAFAQEVYDSRSFERLPELASLLEGIECDNSELLAHLRSPGPHVRGCWALDLILGKS